MNEIKEMSQIGCDGLLGYHEKLSGTLSQVKLQTLVFFFFFFFFGRQIRTLV
jgi:hypothetical protein